MADKARIGTPQVVTRYVPNDWDESQGTTPQVKVASTGGFRPVQVHVVTYEDGTREEFVLNQNGEEAGKIRDLEPNEAIATAYKEKQKATTPTATSQAAAGRQQQSRVLGTNPATGKPAWVITNFDGTTEYDEANVPASAAATPPQYAREPVPGYPGVFAVKTRSKDASGTDVTDTQYQDAAGNPVPDPTGGPTAAQQTAKTESERKENETKKNTWTTIDTKTEKDADGNSVTVLTQQNLLGETRPVRSTVTALKAGEKYGAPQQGANGQVQPVLNAEGKVIRWEPMPEGGPGVKAPTNIIDLPNGGKGQLVDSGRRDPSGNPIWETAPIAGTEKKPDAGVPSVDLKDTVLGKYTQKGKKQWDEVYVPLIQAGTMTKEAALEQFEKVDRPLLQSQANEEIAVLTAQGNIRGQDVSQRGQSLGEVQNQRSNATSTFNQLASVIKPADAGKYYPEIMAKMMEVYGQSTEKLGIPKGVPSDQPYTPQQAQLMGAPGPSPIVFNINTGGAVPQSAPLAGVGAQMGVPYGPEGVGAQMPGAPGALPPPTNPEQLLEEMKRNDPDQFWTAAVDRAGQDLQAAREKAAGGVAPGMSFSGGQLRAPGTGPVGAGPVGQVG